MEMGDRDPFMGGSWKAEDGEDVGDEEDGEFDVCGQECYEFNPMRSPLEDDGCCEHCVKFLTTKCPHLGQFMDEIEE